jgi:hypothetical protein
LVVVVIFRISPKVCSRVDVPPDAERTGWANAWQKVSPPNPAPSTTTCGRLLLSAFILSENYDSQGCADAVNAAAGTRQHVLRSLDHYAFSQDRTENIKLRVAQHGAHFGCGANGAVVLNQKKGTVRLSLHFRHVAFFVTERD